MRTEEFYALALTYRGELSKRLRIRDETDAIDIDIAGAYAVKMREQEQEVNKLDLILDAIHFQTRMLLIAQGHADIGERPSLRATTQPAAPQGWMPRFDESGEVIEDGQDVFVNGEYRGRYGADGDMNINEDLPPLDPSGQGGIHMGGKSGSPTWQTTPTPRVIGGSAGQFYGATQRRNVRINDPDVV